MPPAVGTGGHTDPGSTSGPVPGHWPVRGLIYSGRVSETPVPTLEALHALNPLQQPTYAATDALDA